MYMKVAMLLEWKNPPTNAHPTELEHKSQKYLKFWKFDLWPTNLWSVLEMPWHLKISAHKSPSYGTTTQKSLSWSVNVSRALPNHRDYLFPSNKIHLYWPALSVYAEGGKIFYGGFLTLANILAVCTVCHVGLSVYKWGFLVVTQQHSESLLGVVHLT